MHIFIIPAERAVETGLLVKNPNVWSVSDQDLSSEAFNWFRNNCGLFGNPSHIHKRWYRGMFGWSLKVYHHYGKQFQVKVVIQDPNHAMYFKLKWT